MFRAKSVNDNSWSLEIIVDVDHIEEYSLWLIYISTTNAVI